MTVGVLIKRAAIVTSVGLGALAALHGAWGLGSSFPCRDRSSLADTVAGTGHMPGRVECGAVAGLLASAAVLVAGLLPVRAGVRRVGVVAVVATLGVRGVAGLAGRTDLLVPWSPSERFVRLDRRYYGPLCVALAVGAAGSLTT